VSLFELLDRDVGADLVQEETQLGRIVFGSHKPEDMDGQAWWKDVLVCLHLWPALPPVTSLCQYCHDVHQYVFHAMLYIAHLQMFSSVPTLDVHFALGVQFLGQHFFERPSNLRHA